jgi:glycosidase
MYGDPYDYVQEKGPKNAPPAQQYVWQYGEEALEKQYAGAEQLVWRIELALPRRRRLKYGFRIAAGGQNYYFSENGFTELTAEAVNRAFNHFFFPYIHDVDAPSTPQWAGDTVWYQIFPERFCNGNPALSPAGVMDWEHDEPGGASFFGGDIPGIRQKLDYLKRLGVTGIFLNPVFKAPSNHKYDTADYFAVDEHFGGLRDLKGLVEDAHALGIRVMLDAVFNHVGEKHPFWQDVLEKQENSAYRDYFHIRRFPVKERYRDSRKMGFDAFGFVPGMPKWNTENPAARRYLLDAALYWIRKCDIDGWRLDVSGEVSFDFWKEFVREVRAVKKDFYITGEMWHDASNWINGAYFDAVMNYPLGFAVSDYFLRKKSTAEQFSAALFRVLSRYSDLHNQAAFNLLDSHDTMRALTAAGGDKLALRNAFTMLFLLPGSPCIYYGTEIGMSGDGDPGCRKPMIWDPQKQDRELLAFFRGLIAFRRKYRALIKTAAIRATVIQAAVIQPTVTQSKAMRAAGREELPCWELSGGGHSLSVVYAGDSAVNAAAFAKTPGREVWRTGPKNSGQKNAGQNSNANIPPHSLAVYYK